MLRRPLVVALRGALLVALLVTLLVTMTTALGCSHSAATGRVRSAAVVLPSRAGEQRVEVELARNEAERAHGLMFRQELAPGHGMLFLFDAPDQLTFWMENTYIPLDMIFLDGERRIIYVEANAEPLTRTGRGPKHQLAQFVVEVPGGWCARHGVEPGPTPVHFIDID